MADRKSAQGNKNEIIATLQSIPLFKAFKKQPKKLEAIAKVMTRRKVRSGVRLIAEGDMGENLFILHKGAVQITRLTLENEKYTVAILKDEDHPFFGELALLDEDRRSATIVTIEAGEVLILSRKNFEKLGDDNPDIGLNITRELAKIVSKRVRQTNTDVILLFEALVNEVSNREIA